MQSKLHFFSDIAFFFVCAVFALCGVKRQFLCCAGGWKWDMDSKHAHSCQATWPIWIWVISYSFVLLLVTLYLQLLFTGLKQKTEESAASQLLHLLVCWISKGRAIFAPQKHNVPRSELYIMFKYEKAVSRVVVHEINSYWPPALFESIIILQESLLHQLMEAWDNISWNRTLLMLNLMLKCCSKLLFCLLVKWCHLKAPPQFIMFWTQVSE